MGGAGALAFACQTFSLLSQLLKRILELAGQLVQPFDGRCVREQLNSRRFDLVLSLCNFTEFSA